MASRPLLLDPPSWEGNLAARDRIAALHEELSEHWRKFGDVPSPGSEAEADLREASPGEVVAVAHDQSGQLVEAVADHVLLFVKAITDPGQPIAACTCVRGAMEVAGATSWLLAPGLPARERLRRSCSMRLKNLQEQLTFANSEKDIDRAARVTAQIEKVATRAIALGVDSDRGKKGEVTRLGAPYPGPTALARSELDAEGQYRLFSGAAHGHRWGTQVGFKKETQGVLLIAVKDFSPTLGMALVVMAARCLTLAAWRKAAYCGWGPDRLQELLEVAFDEIGLARTREIRPWSDGT